MAKKGTYGYKAGLERAKAQRRIAAFERLLENENLGARAREQYQASIRDLRAAQQATYSRTKSGKVIEGRTREGLDAALKSLSSMNRQGEQYVGNAARSNIITQSQINMASVGLPSRYTKEEVKVFYRATQKAWQKEGVGEHERNEAILKYYGRSNLKDLVDEVLRQNEVALRAQKVSPESAMTAEQKGLYENEPDIQEDEKSPTTVGEKTRKYLEELRESIIEPERR